jgi:hypothetical protein
MICQVSQIFSSVPSLVQSLGLDSLVQKLGLVLVIALEVILVTILAQNLVQSLGQNLAHLRDLDPETLRTVLVAIPTAVLVQILEVDKTLTRKLIDLTTASRLDDRSQGDR